ncbi:hypothetical protein GCM10023084_33920 [Streptomyces lacrimifluminis]|uniref:Uncharacterized protein n=1 Tax=Streptomyces lacrimifluminis TaxID=1500077 RepID=A0A917KUZ8_9ACTN|nr:hypothetical protein GCM10012282_29770 [Streptomyces lacrimifluminis]
MCVRVKNWREEAQPESVSDTPAGGRSGAGSGWPEAATETKGLSGRAGSTAANSAPVPRQRHTDAPRDPGDSGISFGVPYQRPWENPVEAGHTHDPHEVTVQLDGVGRQVDELLVRQAKEGQDADGVGDGPVFVDETGRRSRRYRRIGMVVGISCAVYAVVIVATLLSGNSNAPWLPVPGQKDEQPAGQVETSPLPTDSAPPSEAAAGVSPAPDAPVSTSATPSRKAGASPAPSVSAAPKPSASASSKPAPSTTRRDPGPSPSVSEAGPSPSVSVSPSPSPSDGGNTSPDPSPSTDPGTDPVASGPQEPSPIASESPSGEAPSPAEPSTASSTSTEYVI